MYPYHRSRKTLVVIILFSFLGSILLSSIASKTRSAQAYFPQDEVNNSQFQSNPAQGEVIGAIKDASIQASVFEARVTPGANDAEERINDGFMYLDSSDLELVNDPGVTRGIQSVGMRFTGVSIPKGATILNAYIEFEVDEVSSEATSLVMYGQAADNTNIFATSAYNITSRSKTAASVSWNNIPAWNTIGAKVQTPSLVGIIQEIVSRNGWAQGNSMVIIIEGSGRRVAAAYEAGSTKAPLLHVDFNLPGGTTTPTPPPPPSTPIPTPTSTNPAPTSTTLPPTATSTPASTSQPYVVNSYVSDRYDDAEERMSDGRMYLTSSDIELVNDPGVTKGAQTVGMRFSGINIPQGSTITEAYIEFEVAEASSETTSLVVHAQSSDNATAFTRTDYDISGRAKTAASVSWNNIPAWNTAGAKVQSPSLTGLVQEVVNYNSWQQGNSLTIIIEGTGRRIAAAYESSSLSPAMLHVVYLPLIATSTPPPPPPPPPSPTQTPPPNPQPMPVGQTGDWQMKFSDDFDGNALNSSKWRTCFWWADVTCTIESNNEMELYNPEDVLVENGLLRLRAQKRDMVAWNGVTYHYTSGMVMTGGRSGQIPPSFTFVYGYIEALVKIPSGQGLWPALWTLSADYGWPPEIDVMEILGHEPDVYHMNYHYVGGNAGSTWNGPDFSAGWHVLGLDWRPDAIIWYVDGVEQWRFTDASKIINEPSYLLLNLAVGGDWPGPPDGSTAFPSYYDIDYVRVWQRP